MNRRWVLCLIALTLTLNQPAAAQFAASAGIRPAVVPVADDETLQEAREDLRRAERRLESILDYPAIQEESQLAESAQLSEETLNRYVEHAETEVAMAEARLYELSAEQPVEGIWLPVRSNEAAERFFGDGFSLVGSTGLEFSGDAGAIYTELFQDNAFLWFAYARIGFGAFVQSAAPEDNEAPLVGDASSAAANAFLSNGGNAALYVALPVSVGSAWATQQQRTDPATGRRSAVTIDHLTGSLFFLPRVGADITTLSGEIDAPALNLEPAAELRLSYTTFSETFRFFGNVRSGFVFGTPVYRERLGVDDWAFFHTYGTFGVDIGDRLRFSFRHVFAGPGVLKDVPLSISVRVLG